MDLQNIWAIIQVWIVILVLAIIWIVVGFFLLRKSFIKNFKVSQDIVKDLWIGLLGGVLSTIILEVRGKNFFENPFIFFLSTAFFVLVLGLFTWISVSIFERK